MKVHRVLEKDGKLFIEVPLRVKKPFSSNSKPLLPHTDKFAGHYREYSIESFRTLVSTFFNVIDIQGVSRGYYVPLEKTRNAVMALLQK